MPHSTKPAKPDKSNKDFPLFPHDTGRWAKKTRQKLHYFGKWDDPQGAYDKWIAQKDDLLVGRTPRAGRDGLTVRDLVNRFLTAKTQQRDSGELTATTFADYHATCREITGAMGLTRLVDDLAADDFEALRATLAKRLEPVALGNRIQRIRTVFKYGYDAGRIDKPVRFGPQFKKPNRRTMRIAKHEKQALGVNPKTVIYPTLVLAVAISLATVFLNDDAVCWGHEGIERQAIASVDEIIYGVLRSQRSFANDRISINVAAVDGRRLMAPIISLPACTSMPACTISAAEAEIWTDDEAGDLRIVCRNGEIKSEGGESKHWSARFPDAFEQRIPLEAARHRNRSTAPAWIPLREIPGEIVRREVELSNHLDRMAACVAGDFTVGAAWPAMVSGRAAVGKRPRVLAPPSHRTAATLGEWV